MRKKCGENDNYQCWLECVDHIYKMIYQHISKCLKLYIESHQEITSQDNNVLYKEYMIDRCTFYKIFYFDIIVAFHVIVRNNTEQEILCTLYRKSTQSPPKKLQTMVHYTIKDIGKVSPKETANYSTLYQQGYLQNLPQRNCKL